MNIKEISKQDFTFLLIHILEKSLEVNFKHFEKQFKKYRIKENTKLYHEFVYLTLYSIVYVCESIFEDTKERNKILDAFHLLVYKKIFEKEKVNFKKWFNNIADKYEKYKKVITRFRESKENFALSDLIIKNVLNQEDNRDVLLRFLITSLFYENIKAIQKTLDGIKVK